MSFIDHRLSLRVGEGFRGGPEFRTLEKELRSGVTRRKPLRTMPKHRYSADYATFDAAEQQELLNAIWVAMGKAYTFRFRDLGDWKVANQALGIGDGTATPIQLIKTYSFGPNTVSRDITLPYKVTMTADGAPFTDFTVDPLTGLATPDTVWPLGAVLAWSGRFDVRVRFADDYNPLTARPNMIHQCSVELIEERYG